MREKKDDADGHATTYVWRGNDDVPKGASGWPRWGNMVTDDNGCCLVMVCGMVPHQSPIRR